MNLENVRKLELLYEHMQPEKAKLFVKYIGGEVKVYEVDKRAVERLLEHLEEPEAERSSPPSLPLSTSFR